MNDPKISPILCILTPTNMPEISMLHFLTKKADLNGRRSQCCHCTTVQRFIGHLTSNGPRTQVTDAVKKLPTLRPAYLLFMRSFHEIMSASTTYSDSWDFRTACDTVYHRWATYTGESIIFTISSSHLNAPLQRDKSPASIPPRPRFGSGKSSTKAAASS